MGSFDASLRTIGDRTGLPATLTVADGRLSIFAGEQAIGEWNLEEVLLEQTPTGYRMAAEGEQILIDMPDAEQFELALRGKKVKAPKTEKEPRRSRVKKPKHLSEKPEAAAATVEPAMPASQAEPVKVATPATSDAPAKDAGASRGGFMETVDHALDKANARWGGLFPSWVFTRGTFFILVGAIVLLLAVPQVVFYLVLLGGVLLVMLGAVLYTDSVLSARWLPGRMTPMHVLLFGVSGILFGVIIGVAAGNLLYRVGFGVLLVGGTYLAMLVASRKTA